ncbi:type I restriction-modification system subunit M [Thiorhodovibrio frisius]|uniref:site-specific DNA-methyltransferase (adenine-specific) n=1 Tax=Thiorhodovibrio frisius TaxID=631362 RepID=H8YWX2_9GAMM|nr:class I SAM-dependent DNA methyltransferase [Thiorhodovibrio frisius]EIC22948.1 type I restriction-modification system methyltransferase subunit [Thiorhodovibrio frisius]WPL22790.1 Type I restriction enzyme EcoKI M protein [Thiorhodovibrio frisius]
MTTNFSHTAAYIWSLADLLRGDFKQSQYGRIILPFTILRRLECVLEARKHAVLEQIEKLKTMPTLEEAAREKFLLRAAAESFYNVSPMDLSKLGSSDIKSNLLTYVDSFSKDAREIFEHFKFGEFVAQLDEANLLFKVVQKVASTDLSPKTISNHDMGLVFEELIRRFAESSNETAGEHFTPRDIVRLTTALVFMEDDDALTEPGIIRTIYDPTAGTGGFLSSGMEYVHELNPNAVMRAFGQELNPESYAICKGDMLIKGQDVSRIKLGNTLSDDQLQADKFDYMLSNPPFGVDWKKVEGEIKNEHKLKGFDGRFGPGLPRVSDGSLLFLMHLLSKMRDYDPNDAKGDGGGKSGGRIGIILNGSPLFTGGAGSGESEIRRQILEHDLLEAIVALPTDMFYNTGIATYIWVLSNKKAPARRGKVQLINGVHLYQKMRKSLGSKRQQLGEDDIALITRTFGNFEAIEPYSLDPEPPAHGGPQDSTAKRGRPSATAKKAEKKTFGSKIFESHAFGYRRISVERPLRLSVQFTDTRLAELRFASGALNAAMQSVYAQFGQGWSDAPSGGTTGQGYGQLAEVEAEVRALIKADFKDLKEAQIKDLLAPKTWLTQQALLNKAKQIQTVIGTEPCHDFNAFERTLKQALKQTDIKLDTKERKQLLDAVTWTNPDAKPVIKKVLKPTEATAVAGPIYGAFPYQGQIVQFQPDSNLRDAEDVPLTAETARGGNVNAVNEAYFNKEVAPHVKDAWIDASKCDERDGQIGIVGYEIPFNRHFYQYQPPRDLAEIDADLDVLSAEIMEMLREVHS